MRYRVILVLPVLLASCGSAPEPKSRTGAGADAMAQGRATERTFGLNDQIMARTVKVAARLPRIRSLIVMRDGKTVAEHRFNDGPPLDRPVNIKSASKSVISALIGMAIERGVLSGVDQPVLSVLRSDAPANPDPRLAKLTIGNLLSMQAGLDRTSGPNYGRWVSSANWVRYALSRPFVDDPGGAMLYSTGSTHILSAMLTRASGRSTYALAQEWLARPLSIDLPSWPRDAQGIFFGGNDMLMSPRGMARFGELYRLGGVIDGQRVLPAAWISQSWTPRTVSPWSGGRYGYGWFLGEARGHPVRFAWGYGGQMIYVLPSLGLTVVMTSESGSARDNGHIQALHALLADHLIPAAVSGR